ncbi:TPA: hypothetical protein DE059_03375, partial [Candidatus Peribacteria bacterium]|nr:hypothetical protein [Candidatus Peribacteria bacterium]
MDEGAGTWVKDYSRYGNHGTMTNMDASTDWITMTGAGTTNFYNPYALDFDGDNDVVSVNDSYLWTFPANLTVSAWVTLDVVSGARVMVGHNYVAPNRGWILYFNSDNTLHWGYSTNGTDSNDTGRSWSPSTGTWYNVIAKRQGNNVQLYVDGTAVGATISMTSVPYNSTGNLYIGDEGSTVSEWDGKIDDVRLYNRALSNS